MAADDVITSHVTAEPGYRTIGSRRLQGTNEHVLDHIGRRLRPALVFVGAKLNGPASVDKAIVAIQVRSGNPADEEPYGKAPRRGLRYRWSAGVQHVIFHGPRSATSRGDSRGQDN